MITFGGVVLENAEPYSQEPDILITKKRLLSGKIKIGSSPEYGFKWTFKCNSPDLTNYISLLGLIGTPRTLDIGGAQALNCYIETLPSAEESGGTWSYTITLVRDTT